MTVEAEASQTSQEERCDLPDVRRPGQVAGDVDIEMFELVYLFDIGTVYYQW